MTQGSHFEENELSLQPKEQTKGVVKRGEMALSKSIAGKKFREGRTRFGGGGTPKNLKFRVNH